MKNFIISLLTVLLVFATSCNEMDQYPHNAVSSDNLTEEDAQLLPSFCRLMEIMG